VKFSLPADTVWRYPATVIARSAGHLVVDGRTGTCPGAAGRDFGN
jgi:hypothetical protein